MARPGITVVLVDGTYELFRQYYGRPAGSTSRPETAATRGVLWTVVSLIERGATHLGVATDHVIVSFRNELWPSYKRGDGVPAELLAQFPLLEAVLSALGVRVWAMVELEADDALGSAASVAAADERVTQVQIWTPDKDLGQCVSGERVVQVESRSGKVIDEAAVLERFGVPPASVPDWLALVGDSADGYPGLPGWGKASASAVLARYGHLEQIPDDPADWDVSLRARVRGAARLAARLAEDRALAEHFRVLASLRIDRSLLGDVDELVWRGPTAEWPELCDRLGDAALAARVGRLSQRGA